MTWRVQRVKLDMDNIRIRCMGTVKIIEIRSDKSPLKLMQYLEWRFTSGLYDQSNCFSFYSNQYSVATSCVWYILTNLTLIFANQTDSRREGRSCRGQSTGFPFGRSSHPRLPVAPEPPGQTQSPLLSGTSLMESQRWVKQISRFERTHSG